MNVLAFAFIFCILVWSSQSIQIYSFTARIEKTKLRERQNYTLTSGSTVRFRCQYLDGSDTHLASWHKDNCHVSHQVLNHCRVTVDRNCDNVTVPSSFECDTKNTIKIYNVTVEDSGGWSCRYYRKNGPDYRSEIHFVEVKPSTTAKVTRSTASTIPETTTHQIKERPSSVSTGIYETGADHNTTRRPAQPTGSQAASNNFLLPVVGASVGGLLIITLIAVIITVKRKRSRKGGRTTEPPNHENVPEAEMIDPDGQYASIGQMEVPKMEPNPMYESYEGNQNQNQDQTQNRNQSGSISFAQDTGGDVYSVVQKKQDPPDTEGVHSTPDQDTGGDVYSVVQKKKQDPPATERVQSAPDQDITDVYSVVQKPGKTSQ